MKYYTIFFILIVISCLVFIFSTNNNQSKIQVYLEKNLSLIGTNVPQKLGFEGQGIKIGIIDTGVDYNHPDLLGFGPQGKVVGGYDFVNQDEKPLDANGHGTEVAGIISADGNLTGVAPKSKLFAYKVSSSGESVSSDLIVQAVYRAIQDKVGVINISLGVNKTNEEIDAAVEDAVKSGIVVVAAAGNNGPDENTIGTPGKDVDVITVGASYNNITSSLVSTLEVGKTQYQVLPMVGTKPLSELINAKIVYGGYGRADDLVNVNTKGSILLEERGSNVKGEKVYFAEKERNAAQSGAKALVVYNNEPGIFFGELVQPNSSSEYTPTIPVISMSRNDGLALKASLQNETIGKLDVFYHPDFVAPFSSRGPVSPFYIKPDLVAPGVFVNSTLIGGKYNLTSGTSIAAPHVTGAVALLLQKNPNLKPDEIASILSTTTDPVTDAYGNIIPIDVAGSGRLNITKAFLADLIIVPHSLVFDLSFEKSSQTKTLHLKNINGIIPHLSAQFLTKEKSIKFNYLQENDSLNIVLSDNEKNPGNSEGMLVINDTKILYRIPVLVHLTNGTINTIEENGILTFSLDFPQNWSYAKVSVTKSGTDIPTVASIVPQKNSSLKVHEAGEYWIEALITTPTGIDVAYDTVLVHSFQEKTLIDFLESTGIPLKQILIISIILVATVIVGLKSRPAN